MLSDSDRTAIEDLQRRWLAHESGGGADGLLECCTEDVIWMPPTGRALHGRAEILDWLGGQPRTTDEVTLTNLRIDGDAHVAYKVADFRAVSTQAGSDESLVSSGSHMWVLRRDSRDSWKVVVVAWSIRE
jgi:ketosteroid isomerase-like protein